MSTPKPVIRVKNLGKKYTISGPQEKYLTLRDAIVNSVKVPFKRFHQAPPNEGFWALKDISFDVEQGQVVGIIGRNGAGKSTLLKILSRITAPTEGTIELHGRVGSLLEVGTGFHPEMTGRENIFLNGSILGMRKTEIEQKFDEIVKFAEIDKFIDTPVKRYSSGMYVRLAFAVAAHLEPEILVVDEVLAVGDAQFQKKCLGKMGEVAKEGRTVLFVSHNMGAIRALCETGILLEAGSIIKNEAINSLISTYLNNMTDLNGEYNDRLFDKNKKLKIVKISLLKNGIITTQFFNSDHLTIRVEFFVSQKLIGAQIALELFSENGICILSSTSQDWDGLKPEILPGKYAVDCPIDLSIFRNGHYSIKVSSSIPCIENLDIIETMLIFEILNDPDFVLQLGQGRKGIIMPLIKWSPVKCS